MTRSSPEVDDGIGLAFYSCFGAGRQMAVASNTVPLDMRYFFFLGRQSLIDFFDHFIREFLDFVALGLVLIFRNFVIFFFFFQRIHGIPPYVAHGNAPGFSILTSYFRELQAPLL